MGFLQDLGRSLVGTTDDIVVRYNQLRRKERAGTINSVEQRTLHQLRVKMRLDR